MRCTNFKHIPDLLPAIRRHVLAYPYANVASISLVDTKGKTAPLARKLLRSKRRLALENLGDHE
jgi:hypothetical protein